MRRAAALVPALLAGLIASPAVGAVSVVLGSSDPDAVYESGETITLTVYVTANGGEVDNGVFGSVLYPFEFVSPGTRVQYALPDPAGSWVLGATSCANLPNRCNAFNQILVDPVTGQTPRAANVTNFLIATLSFTVVSAVPGQFEFAWRTSPTVLGLDFFGVTSAPGYSVTIVPEPTTATLLAVGLLGLALAGRRPA